MKTALNVETGKELKYSTVQKYSQILRLVTTTNLDVLNVDCKWKTNTQ